MSDLDQAFDALCARRRVCLLPRSSHRTSSRCFGRVLSVVYYAADLKVGLRGNRSGLAWRLHDAYDAIFAAEEGLGGLARDYGDGAADVLRDYLASCRAVLRAVDMERAE